MTVTELITTLSAIEDKSLTVTIDGCDCDAEASAVYISGDGDQVYISREDTRYLHQRDDTLVTGTI